jgi:hypothetical protein
MPLAQQRQQLHASKRIGALMGQLRYQHLGFQLYPPLAGRFKARIVLKVNMEHIN